MRASEAEAIEWSAQRRARNFFQSEIGNKNFGAIFFFNADSNLMYLNPLFIHQINIFEY